MSRRGGLREIMMVDSIYNYPIISDDIPCDLLIFADMFDRSL